MTCLQKWCAASSHGIAVGVCCLFGLFAASTALAIEEGEPIFKRACAMCHSLDPGRNRVGPSLADVVDRPAGSVPGFNYSSANSQSNVVWTKDNLNDYLADPQKVLPGTLMTFPGLKNPDDRKAVIDFLAGISGK